jgi:excinuclease ABC subunit C
VRRAVRRRDRGDAVPPARRELCEFLDGDTDDIIERLEKEMRGAATELEFERAARLRDRLHAVQKAVEKQQMVADKDEDLDVIGIAEDELEASVQVFFVRKGRWSDARGSCSTRSRTSRPVC